ncbi:hypothetical protein AYO40_00480 [Planctomycetaceae bacterium SCGC AG-212-D15]|nr:hypothetical protein AYO40_00480 [Planctomycetaceae bacterium SCGC AG-212-D15]
MQFKAPLIIVMCFAGGAGVVCLVMGIVILVPPLSHPFDASSAGIIGGGLFIVAGLVVCFPGLGLLLYSFACLRDILSSSVSTTGRVTSRRKDCRFDSNGRPVTKVIPTYYLMVGSEEFQVPECDYERVTDNQEVTITYLPNTRTVESVRVVRPAWVTPTVVALASAIIDEQGFERLPILADALEEAGYPVADIMKRCRMVTANEECQALIERIMQEIVAAKGVNDG